MTCCFDHVTALSTLYVTFSFFFNDTATTEIYTLSLHDALPISLRLDERLELDRDLGLELVGQRGHGRVELDLSAGDRDRSEEHTSELQSRLHLVCRLLLEKKKKKKKSTTQPQRSTQHLYAMPPS